MTTEVLNVRGTLVNWFAEAVERGLADSVITQRLDDGGATYLARLHEEVAGDVTEIDLLTDMVDEGLRKLAGQTMDFKVLVEEGCDPVVTEISPVTSGAPAPEAEVA